LPIQFSLIVLYYHLCNYGEGFRNQIIISVIIVTLSTIYFLMQTASTIQLSLNHDNVALIGNAIYKSLTAFLQLRSDSVPDYIIRIASAPVLGTLFIALRRKFERRFRH